jgi:hypothetical protein
MHKIAILAVGFALANCHTNAHSEGDKKSSVASCDQPHHSVPDAGNTLTLALVALGSLGATGFAFRRFVR